MKPTIILCLLLKVALFQVVLSQGSTDVFIEPDNATEAQLTTVIEENTVTEISNSSTDEVVTEVTKNSEQTTETYISNYQNTICNFTACQQPNCMCLNDRPPNGLHPKQIPQFVLVTFDGAVTVTNYPYYKDLFTYKNPNGCPISSTFFVSHMDTNYNLVHELYRRGNEIATNSISQAINNIQNYWRTLNYEGWRQEFGGQKKIVSQYADIPLQAIKGARAPNLQTAGNDTFAALFDEGYTYDCSNPSRKGINTPFFPYTLDYGFQRDGDCPVEPCLPAKQTYPGFWEIPMNDWNVKYTIRDELRNTSTIVNRECASASGCLLFNEDGTVDYDPTDDKVYQLFSDNFHRFYDRNRAPFPIFLSEEWMGLKSHRDGFAKFIQEVSTLENVYFVTIEEVIEWMKNSRTLEEYAETQCKEVKDTACAIHNNDEFEKEFKKHCDYANIKELNIVDKRMFICPDQNCPAKYPWLEN